MRTLPFVTFEGEGQGKAYAWHEAEKMRAEYKNGKIIVKNRLTDGKTYNIISLAL